LDTLSPCGMNPWLMFQANHFQPMREVKGTHSFVWPANEKDTGDSFVLLTNERERNPFLRLSSPFFVILSAGFGEVRHRSFIPSSISVCSPRILKRKMAFSNSESGTFTLANCIWSTQYNRPCPRQTVGSFPHLTRVSIYPLLDVGPSSASKVNCPF